MSISGNNSVKNLPSLDQLFSRSIWGVIINKESARKSTGKTFDRARILEDHAIFNQSPSPFAAQLGIPLLFILGGYENDDSQPPNLDAAYLDRNVDGSLVDELMKNKRSVIVVRADKKDLEWQQVAALAYYSRFAQQEMEACFQNLHPVDRPNAVAENYWTKEMFDAFFKLFRLRMEAVHARWRTDVSPYTVKKKETEKKETEKEETEKEGEVEKPASAMDTNAMKRIS